MDDLVLRQNNLPNSIEDLSKFALVGREKLAAVRAEIRAIQKVGLAKEVLEQKKAEAQEIAELVTLSEVKIGAMLKEIPKAQGKRTDITSNPKGQEVETKADTVRELGFTPKQTAQFQQMAEHEEEVHEAIAEARKNDDIISRSAVLRKIEEKKKPHVVNNSGDNEWYTPAEYIEAARTVMGTINLDPASNDFANETVKAETYYTEETNGLAHEWTGNIWMNPPYSGGVISQFVKKLVESDFTQAIVLVNNATDTEWFRMLTSKAKAIVFTTGRIRFVKRDGAKNTPLQGQAFVYFGKNRLKFVEVFSRFGWGCFL